MPKNAVKQEENGHFARDGAGTPRTWRAKKSTSTNFKKCKRKNYSSAKFLLLLASRDVVARPK
jgi:hypothetical protein